MTPLPDDPAALVQLAQAALAPAGCLDVTADVRQRAAVSAVHSDRVWTFTGRIEGGAWTVMEWTPVVDPEGGVNTQLSASGAGPCPSSRRSTAPCPTE
jgi:hypothetical protein